MMHRNLRFTIPVYFTPMIMVALIGHFGIDYYLGSAGSATYRKILDFDSLPTYHL
jgi:hypothetical protein